jgi:uncharacterized protein YjiS (DUF1127 family)
MTDKKYTDRKNNQFFVFTGIIYAYSNWIQQKQSRNKIQEMAYGIKNIWFE